MDAVLIVANTSTVKTAGSDPNSTGGKNSTSVGRRDRAQSKGFSCDVTQAREIQRGGTTQWAIMFVEGLVSLVHLVVDHEMQGSQIRGNTQSVVITMLGNSPLSFPLRSNSLSLL